MLKEKCDNYKRNKKTLSVIERAIAKLEEKRSEIPEVSIKVQKSSDDFPYTEGHLTVKASEPKASDKLERRILEKEKRKKQLEADIDAVEEFIGNLPEGMEKDIFEMVYLDGMTQEEVGKSLGYTQSMVSKVIKDALKHS